MRCPICNCLNTKVVDSRHSDDGIAIRRRRECLTCAHRFTTYERLCLSSLIVKKSDGTSQVYDRDKLMRGLFTACAKRPINPSSISELIDDLESDFVKNNTLEITSSELGSKVLEKLKKLDDVAFVRFASVYKHFQDIKEFSNIIEEMD